MTKSIIRAALVATVSAATLVGTAHAQQAQQNQQRQQQMQSGQNQSGQNQQQMQQGPREYQQVRGTIENVRRVNLRNGNERAIFVQLQTEDGRRAVVDLGTDVRVRLNRGSEIAVRGRVVELGGQRYVLQANAFRYEGRTIDANRPMMQIAGGSSPRGEQGQRQDSRQAQTRDPGQARMSSSGTGQGENRPDQQGKGRMINTLFDRYDANGNDALSISEWDRAIDRTFGENAVQLQVENWDRDNNGQISRGEFQRGMRASGLISRMPMGG